MLGALGGLATLSLLTACQGEGGAEGGPPPPPGGAGGGNPG